MAEFEEKKYNLRNIKSAYIIKEVFSFLNVKKKLNLIIYYKELQTLLSVTIKDYKIISGKYKEGKKNGKGREYLIKINLLIFEGNYLNGEKSGKGKEYYDNGNLKFEEE